MDLNSWSSFDGYGPLPGIQRAVFEVETSEIEGTVIRAYNTDGSTHKEKIVTWQPPDSFTIKLYDFPSPLCYLSSHFIEQWEFRKRDDTEIVNRSLELYPNNIIVKPLVWGISKFFIKAISRHLEKIANGK
ncbi:MAG: hypothetical protein U5K72_08835 [Balneolaceae bacterium]|nr:hypothetical protein [Balneolaceae bacterium]